MVAWLVDGLAQISSTVFMISTLHFMKITKVRFVPDTRTLVHWNIVATAFLVTIYCNLKVLQYLGKA